MANLFDLGLQGYNAWQLNDSFNDARDDLKAGFNQARSDVTSTQQPYSDFGLPHMQDYNAMGEFGFDFNNDYLNSQNYKWLRDQGQQGVERSAAASPQGFLSGKTLTDIADWNQQFAQSQYQQEWERQQKAYDTNRAYHQFPIEFGGKMAQNLGDNLADISIGRGASLANMEAAKGQALARILSSTGAALSPSTGRSGDLSAVGGIAGTFMDAAGNVIDQAGNLISNIWEGGGLDGQGDWGLLGDLGGLISGGFGKDQFQGSWLQGLGLENITDWDIDQLTQLWDTPGIDYGQGSWFEGLDQIDQSVLDLINNDSWWDNLDIGNIASEAWGDFTGWVSSLFG